MIHTLPVLITSVAVIITLFSYYYAFPATDQAGLSLQSAAALIFAMAVPLGAISSLIRDAKKVVKREKGEWFFGLVSIIAMLATFFSGFAGPQIGSSTILTWLYNNIALRLGVVLYAVVGFYVVYAMFRALTVRNKDVGIMTVMIIIVMLGTAPFGELLWSGFPTISDWTQKILNVGGQRGILIGVAIGTIALGLRTLIGVEIGRRLKET